MVNGREISREDFDDQMEFARATYEQQGEEVPTGLALADLEQQVVEQMIQQELILAEADKRQVVASDDEIQTRYQETAASFGDEAAFQAEGLDEAEVKALLADNIKIRKLLAGLVAEAALPPPTEEDLHGIYNEYAQQGGTDTFENVRSMLESEAVSRQESAVVASFVGELQAAASIEIFLGR